MVGINDHLDVTRELTPQKSGWWLRGSHGPPLSHHSQTSVSGGWGGQIGYFSNMIPNKSFLTPSHRSQTSVNGGSPPPLHSQTSVNGGDPAPPFADVCEWWEARILVIELRYHHR